MFSIPILILLFLSTIDTDHDPSSLSKLVSLLIPTVVPLSILNAVLDLSRFRSGLVLNPDPALDSEFNTVPNSSYALDTNFSPTLHSVLGPVFDFEPSYSKLLKYLLAILLSVSISLPVTVPI
ncbi:hypothetical protein EVAR_86566_1 [Eumeta japonica]|uniref:Uncharacterized protein n=1 Tax=Eumeta variegata TaxID=151549 RepID=A0A4C2A4F9_EUMVA|nr:hypothetical protein EVAR_86566_1 [Eumeta japonica]